MNRERTRLRVSVYGLALVAVLVPFGTSNVALAQEQQPSATATQKSPLLFIDKDKLKVEGRVDLAIGAYGYKGTFFNLEAIHDPNYNSRRRFMEGGFVPGLDVQFRPRSGLEIYGGVSLGFSGSWGTDIYDERNQSSISLEEAFAGLRTTNPETSWNFDLSAGQQDYVAGTGMLIALGAENGFDLGALNLQPRTAWSQAALARFSYNRFRIEGFYLDPNLLDALDTGDRIVGGFAEYRFAEESKIGLGYIKVLRSRLEYPVASPPFSIEGGRGGLGSIDVFAEVGGDLIGISNAWFRGEFALQRNARIDMKAYAVYGAAGYRFEKNPWSPGVSVEYAVFSGDDRETSRYERFDPLFFGDGSVSWYFGADSSVAFVNSNIDHVRISLDMKPSEKNSLAFQYIHSRANKLFSPLQFNEYDREEVIDGVPTFVVGVPKPHLSDEIYGEWRYNFRPNLSVKFWGSTSFPGSGLKALPRARTETWLGAGAVFSLSF